ncbi:hypothetical protein EAI89_07985 [Eubacterium sp. am_0171]|nr:hypothetical protein EAI89_07985 [Eubacterium sp. am_0171]
MNCAAQAALKSAFVKQILAFPSGMVFIKGLHGALYASQKAHAKSPASRLNSLLRQAGASWRK